MIAHYCWWRHGKISGGSTLAKVLACGLMLSCVTAVGQDALLENALTAEEAKRAIARDDYVHIVAAELSEGAADVLGTFSGGLRLVLGNLSMPVAERLAKHRGEMSIDVTRTLPDTVIAALQEHRGELCVTTPRQRCYSSKADDEDAAYSPPGSPPNTKSSPTREKASPAAITPATTPVAHPTVQAASGTKALTVEQAKSLADGKGTVLYAGGLSTLSVEAAKALAEFKGEVVYLRGLETLPPDAAAALSKFRGESLNFSGGLPTLSSGAAKSLAEFEGRTLDLAGLRTLSREVAEALSAFKGESLVLDGLTVLSPEAAKALSQFKGKTLHLKGVPTLAPEVAESLRGFKGQIKDGSARPPDGGSGRRVNAVAPIPAGYPKYEALARRLFGSSGFRTPEDKVANTIRSTIEMAKELGTPDDRLAAMLEQSLANARSQGLDDSFAVTSLESGVRQALAMKRVRP